MSQPARPSGSSPRRTFPPGARFPAAALHFLFLLDEPLLIDLVVEKPLTQLDSQVASDFLDMVLGEKLLWVEPLDSRVHFRHLPPQRLLALFDAPAEAIESSEQPGGGLISVMSAEIVFRGNWGERGDVQPCRQSPVRGNDAYEDVAP